MNTRTISTCLTDAIKAMDVFAYIVRWMASVMNAAQGCAQAVLTYGAIAGKDSCAASSPNASDTDVPKCNMANAIRVYFRHAVSSSCCVRRIRPYRPISPTRHRALLAKHHGLIGDEVAIVEGKNEANQEPQGKTAGRPSAL